METLIQEHADDLIEQQLIDNFEGLEDMASAYQLKIK